MLFPLISLALTNAINPPVLPIQVDGELCHPRNLLVKVDSFDRHSELESAGFKIVRDIPEIGYVVVESPSRELKRFRSIAQALPGVQRVDYDRAAKPAYTPNDPMWSDQWHTRAIKGDLAWDITKGSSNVIIAVLDTGVDRSHPDLAGNIWVNSGEIPGNGLDDDHNGYVDDVYGWDFAYGDNDPSDDYGHGTACSGLVAAIQDNSIGVSGMAPGCKIMCVKIANSAGYFYDSANIPGYIYAANMGAKVFSMSFFSDRVSAPEEDALKYAVSKGVLPVGAAGNDATVYSYYPGAYDCVLGVAALDGSMNKAGFSDYGSWVDVSSPGVSLATITNGGGYTTGFAGTSGACPQVAGIAALCFSAKPAATPQEVMNAIEDSATTQSQAPYGEFASYGQVNAQLAVQRILGASVPSKPSVMRWISPLPPSLRGPRQIGATARLYGRGLGLPNTVQITFNGRPRQITSQSRDYIDFAQPAGSGTFGLTVNGSQVTTLKVPARNGYVCPITECSAPGASVTGGFAEGLDNDSVFLTCTRRGDGFFLLQGAFRNVPKTTAMTLTVSRKYSGTTGTESVQLYDWSTASYPYGNYVTLDSRTLFTGKRTDTYTLTNPSRFVDPNGVVYFQIVTSNDVPDGTTLSLDTAYLQFNTMPGPSFGTAQ